MVNFRFQKEVVGGSGKLSFTRMIYEDEMVGGSGKLSFTRMIYEDEMCLLAVKSY